MAPRRWLRLGKTPDATRKFADVPKASKLFIQLALMLPASYVFCYLSGQRLPQTLLEAAWDIGVMFFTLLIFIPVLLTSMIVLKLFFYGSVMGTKLRVSSALKMKMTIVFMLVAVPVASFIQAQVFLRLTGRPPAPDFAAMILNMLWLILADAPGLALSLYGFKAKIAAVEKQRREAGA